MSDPSVEAAAFRAAEGIEVGLSLAGLRRVALGRGWWVESRVVPGESGRTFHDGSRWTIWIDGSSAVRRNRFTLCHEMGHALLGERGTHPEREEVWCNRFASELLLPRQELGSYVEDHPDWGLAKVAAVADHFSVTETCALIAMNRALESSLATMSLRRVGARWLLTATMGLPRGYQHSVHPDETTGAAVAQIPTGPIIELHLPLVVAGRLMQIRCSARRRRDFLTIAVDRRQLVSTLKGAG